MAFIAELTLRDPILFEELFERVPAAKCTFEDVHYTTDNGGTRYVFFWWTSGCSFGAFESALGFDPTVSEFRAITTVSDRRLYRIVVKRFPAEQPLVFPFFREHDVTALESKRTKSGLHLQARFPSREALLLFRQAGAEIASRIELNRLYSENTRAPEQLLTEKQREVLTLATRRGYFETQSDVTLASLAVILDISPQAVSKHLRTAVRKIVTREVDHQTGIESG